MIFVEPLTELRESDGSTFIVLRDPEGLIDDLKLQADVVDSPWYEDPDKRHRRRYQTFEVEYEGGVCRLMDHAKFHTEKTPRYLELVRRWEQAGQLNEARKLKTDVPTKTPATP